jgi:hypothetical protein
LQQTKVEGHELTNNPMNTSLNCISFSEYRGKSKKQEPGTPTVIYITYLLRLILASQLLSKSNLPSQAAALIEETLLESAI